MNKKQQEKLDNKIDGITALIVSKSKMTSNFGITTCCMIDGEFILVSDYDIYDPSNIIIPELERLAIKAGNVDTFENALPAELESVLAEIHSLNDLGETSWHEVIYHDGDYWCSYSGSRTFKDSESVKKWKYVKSIM